MNVIVCVKQIPDPALPGELVSGSNTLKREGKLIMDDSDSYGVEMALQLVDAAGGGEVSLVSMAPNGEVSGLRTALAMGAARAVLVSDPELSGSDALTTAKVIASAVQRLGGADLVIAGTESSDGYTGTVPEQVAELLGWPCAYWIMEETIDADGKSVRAARQVEGGLEVFDLPLPAVLAAQKGLNEPRYPTLKGIMGAKKKEIKDVKAADLGLTAEPPALSVVKLESLPPRPPGRIIQGEPAAAAKELVRALREDSKAI
jgi:electron transfer flavoprotein beta subunit